MMVGTNEPIPMAPTELILRRIGNSLGVILPAEIRAELGGAKAGDRLLITSQDGEWRLQLVDSAFRKKLAALRTTIKRYRIALRELAK